MEVEKVVAAAMVQEEVDLAEVAEAGLAAGASLVVVLTEVAVVGAKDVGR